MREHKLRLPQFSFFIMAAVIINYNNTRASTQRSYDLRNFCTFIARSRVLDLADLYNNRIAPHIQPGARFLPRHAEALAEHFVHESDAANNNIQNNPQREHIGRQLTPNFNVVMAAQRRQYGIDHPMRPNFNIREGVDIWQTRPRRTNVPPTPWHQPGMQPDNPTGIPSHEVKHKSNIRPKVMLSYFQRRQARYYIVFRLNRHARDGFIEFWGNNIFPQPPNQIGFQHEQARIMITLQQL